MEIGSFIINILTTGMYPEPLDALREYIQNSYDAIRSAERAELLRPNFGQISIVIDAGNARVIIRDNGVGIPASEARSRLLDIGKSTKVLGDDAGFRGIGRLAGLAYCKSAEFHTSSKGEAEKTILVFEAEEIRKNISPKNRKPETAVQLVERLTRIKTEPCAEGEHFFEVHLIGVDSETCPFLDRDRVKDYLRQVAPVEFDTQAFTYGLSKVNPYLEMYGVHRSVNLAIEYKGRKVETILKPYRTFHHAGNKTENRVDIVDIETVVDSSDAPKWIGWLSKPQDLKGAIAEDEVKGIRLRMNNILIGDNKTMVRIFEKVAKSYGRFNSYYSGEVHILDPDVIPNARRDYFEDNEAWRKVESSLVNWARPLARRAYENLDERKRNAELLEKDANQLFSEIELETTDGFVTVSHRKSAEKKLKKLEEKLNKAILSNGRAPDEVERLKSTYNATVAKREELEGDWKGIIDESSLSRDERKLLRLVLEVVFEKLGQEPSKVVAVEVNRRLKTRRDKDKNSVH